MSQSHEGFRGSIAELLGYKNGCSIFRTTRITILYFFIMFCVFISVNIIQYP